MPLPYAVELGLKGARRHPRTVLLAVFTLALGLASVMTMLTLLTLLSADPLPGLSQQLYTAWVESRQAPKSNDDMEPNPLPPSHWKLGDAKAFIAAHPDIAQTALAASYLTVGDEDGKRRRGIYGVMALGPMPAMFGVPLRHGRAWTTQEERAATPVAIVGHTLSLKLFGTENGVGKQIRVGKHLFRVIGISDDWHPRPAFYFIQSLDTVWSETRIELFVPVQAALDAAATPLVEQQCDDTSPGGVRFNEINVAACRWMNVWAQLRTPTQVNSYRDALLAFASARHAAGIYARSPKATLHSVPEWLDVNGVVPDNVRLNFWLTIALLALCVVNVAGLLAARFFKRAGEIGVHRVLGAPRRAVFVRCLTEAGLIGLLGGLLALPATLFGLWVVRLQDQSYSTLARFQPELFLPLLLLAVCTGLLVGLIPAWRAVQLQPALQVKSL